MTPIFSKLTGCILNIATVATLGTWDAGHLEEGARAWTADVRDVWVLAKNALDAFADGITIIAATGAGANAYWIRQSQGDMYWSFDDTWYVDPAVGVDTNRGTTPGQAIKTVAELSRRLVQVRQNSTFTVNVLGDVPNTDSFVDRRKVVGGTTSASAYGSVITFQGQRTVTAAITLAAGTQQTLPTRAAATAQAEAVLGAGSWVAADVGKLVVDSAGNTAFILSEKTAGATARVTDWIASNDSYAAAPVTEGNASVTTLTRWRAPVTVGGNGVTAQPTVAYALSFRDLDFDDVGNNVRPFMNQGAVCFFSRCRISNANGGTVLRFFAAGSTGFAQFTGCLVHNTSPIALAQFVLGDLRGSGLALLWTFGNGFRSAILTLSSTPNRVFGACVQNGYIECANTIGFQAGPDHILGSTSASGAWVGVYNDFNTFATAIVGAIVVNAGARIRVEGSVYGTQVGTASAGGMSGLASLNGGIMFLPKNMDAAVTANKCFNLVPAGAGTEFYLDGLANTTGSITAANGGAVLPTAIVCTTFALYIGAVPNAWARNMRNPANNGGFYQGL